MNDPRWISREEVEKIHELMIEIGGGADGIRDPDLLESALGSPRNHHAYGESDIFQLAAGYAESISRNHPFVDGNKRTAFQTADVFLAANGQHLEKAQSIEHAETMEKLAQGQITREEMGRYLGDHSREISEEQSQSDVEPEPEPDQPEAQTYELDLDDLRAKAEAHRDSQDQSQDIGEDP